MRPFPDDIATAITAIAADHEHGAGWLARASARILEDVCARAATGETVRMVYDAAHQLAASRPSMAAVANTVARVWRAGTLTDVSTAERLRAMGNEAGGLQRLWDTAAPAIATHAAPMLTGALYLHSRSATVEATLRAIAASRTERRVIVGESRPGGEGVALARSLLAEGWDVTLVADAACGVLMRAVDAVVIGADSVRADGSVVNKVGSYPLALVARAAGVPFYVVCETLKVAPAELPLALESLPPDTLMASPPAGLTVNTIAFDVTPAELVTGVVTENGLATTAEIERLAALASAAYRELMRPYLAPAAD
jgi:translation initiation factor 2B subunit (eIF-2B alpha/beta/delta family)